CRGSPCGARPARLALLAAQLLLLLLAGRLLGVRRVSLSVAALAGPALHLALALARGLQPAGDVVAGELVGQLLPHDQRGVARLRAVAGAERLGLLDLLALEAHLELLGVARRNLGVLRQVAGGLL